MRGRGLGPPENPRSFGGRAGVDQAPLRGNSQAILGSGDGQRMLRAGHVPGLMKAVVEASREINPLPFANGLAAVQGADAIVGGPLFEDLAFTHARVERAGPPRVPMLRDLRPRGASGIPRPRSGGIRAPVRG